MHGHLAIANGASQNQLWTPVFYGDLYLKIYGIFYAKGTDSCNKTILKQSQKNGLRWRKLFVFLWPASGLEHTNQTLSYKQ